MCPQTLFKSARPQETNDRELSMYHDPFSRPRFGLPLACQNPNSCRCCLYMCVCYISIYIYVYIYIYTSIHMDIFGLIYVSFIGIATFAVVLVFMYIYIS